MKLSWRMRHPDLAITYLFDRMADRLKRIADGVSQRSIRRRARAYELKMAKEADADIAAANDAFYSKQRTSPVRLHDMYDAVSVYGTSDGLTFKTANGHEAIIRMSQTTSLQLREILGIPTRDIIAKPKKMRKTPPRGKNEPPSAQVN